MKTFSKIEGNINLFVRVVNIKGEKVPFFSTSISTKNKDGSYTNASMDVRLSKTAKAEITAFDKKQLDNGSFLIKAYVADGWLQPVKRKDSDFLAVGLFINDVDRQAYDSSLDLSDAPW